MRHALTITLTIALALTACAPRSRIPTPTHTPPQPREHPNVAIALAPTARTPIVQGAHWTYHHHSLPAPHTLHIQHHQDDHATVFHRDARGVERYYLIHAPARGRDGVYLLEIHADTHEQLDPPLELLPPERALEIGARWGGTHELIGGTHAHLEHTATVLTRQVISTSAGEAIAYQIHHAITRHDNQSLRNLTYSLWYAPYVGYLTTPDGATLQRALIHND